MSTTAETGTQTVAPQNLKAMPEIARLVGALEDIILQGRRRGLGVTVISPRPAIVNTSIRSACEVLIAMQIVGPHDRNRQGLKQSAETDHVARCRDPPMAHVHCDIKHFIFLQTYKSAVKVVCFPQG